MLNHCFYHAQSFYNLFTRISDFFVFYLFIVIAAI